MQIYLIINHLHESTGIVPYLYIGSDSKDREHYMGSCRSLSLDINTYGINQFSKIVLWHGSELELQSLGFSSITDLENTFHESLSVVKDDKFYNKATAHGKFNTEGRANYYYLSDVDKKIHSLPVDHPDVISGLAVGMAYGKKFTITEESIQKRIDTSIARYGVSHPCKSEFVKNKLKKPKSTETKIRMSHPKSEEHKANMRKPKSDAHKLAMSLNHKNNTSVDQLDDSGQIIARFPTITAAARTVYPHLNFLSARTAIGLVCMGKRKSYNGDYWKYTNADMT